MPQVNPQTQPPSKAERTALNKTFRKFKGVYTKSARNAVPEDHFFDLTNIIPIGDANGQTCEALSSSLYNFASDTIYYSLYVQIGTTAYQICASTTGKVFAYNWSNATVTTLVTGLAGSGLRAAAFYDLYLLVVDGSGYYTWNGTTWTKTSGADFPASGTDIAVYSGRVWVSSGRLITISSAYNATSTTDPTEDSAWQAANGATFAVMTDQELIGPIQRLWPQNGFLYVVGMTCVYAISNVYVPYGAIPPAPVYEIDTVQSIIGSDQPLSCFAFGRLFMIANRYGAWAIQGVQAQRISEDIDGTWQYLSFSPAISGAQCLSRNILNAAFLLTRSNDPIFGSGAIIALFFDAKWWFANIGTATLISPAVINNVPAAIAFIANQMYQIFGNAASTVSTRAMTALWAMEDALALKEVTKAGVEITTNITGGSAEVTVDGINSTAVLSSQLQPGSLTFLGAGADPITFLGAGDVAINWIVGSYQLYAGAGPGALSQYVGMTLTSSGLGFQLSSFFMDYKLAARWVGQ